MIDLLQPYGLKEVTRTGTVAVPRGTQKAAAETFINHLILASY